jgi:hypothetical protein
MAVADMRNRTTTGAELKKIVAALPDDAEVASGMKDGSFWCVAIRISPAVAKSLGYKEERA